MSLVPDLQSLRQNTLFITNKTFSDFFFFFQGEFTHEQHPNETKKSN